MLPDLDALCRRIVHEAPDAVIVADAAGVIRLWNGGAERIFGFSAEEAVGASLDIIIPDRLRARHWAGYEQTMATGRTRYGAGDLLAVPGLRKDGSRVSLEFTILPLTDDGGNLAGVAAILRDVTRRFDEMKDLRRRLAAAEGARR